MPNISIISSSIRPERKSHRVALYFKKYLEENNISKTDILDLKIFSFPIFDTKLESQKNPARNLLDFADKIKSSDGIIIITPEYNGSYPASLKNAIDVLYQEWNNKPVAIVTVSSGPFGGSQALLALQFTLWKMKAWTIPAFFSVPDVENAYDKKGNATDEVATHKLADVFIKELLRCVEYNFEISETGVM